MDAKYEDLYKWIEEHTISRPKRNINRDFSDAIPLVEILKAHFPKLVEIHNYSPKNSYAQKLVNWETLNVRVLKRLNLHLTKNRIELLAKGEPGAVEKLLIEIKKKAEAKLTGDDVEVVYLETSPTKGQKLGSLGTIRRSIPLTTYEKLQSELAEKSEAIEIMQKKQEQLERLLDLKEERISDLAQQIQILEAAKVEQAPPQTKFFGLFHSSQSSKAPAGTPPNEPI